MFIPELPITPTVVPPMQQVPHTVTPTLHNTPQQFTPQPQPQTYNTVPPIIPTTTQNTLQPTMRTHSSPLTPRILQFPLDNANVSSPPGEDANLDGLPNVETQELNGGLRRSKRTVVPVVKLSPKLKGKYHGHSPTS